MLPFPGPASRLIGSDLRRLLRRRTKGDSPAARGPFSGLGTERVSTEFGYDRGKPLDRHYVEDFLARHAQLIHGHVLEIGDTAYTTQFGGDRVVSAEAFHRFAGQPGVTYVGDISGVHNLPGDTFDCMVLTQTLHLIFDMPAAIATIWKALKPGGSVLVTVPLDHLDRQGRMECDTVLGHLASRPAQAAGNAVCRQRHRRQCLWQRPCGVRLPLWLCRA
ncbi:class I SAM-dependent methyltransferase [Devosia sp. A8/3-2]|nr:class I SAM-dependent methyltransferase [Devosia sp. A8/3-2]